MMTRAYRILLSSLLLLLAACHGGSDNQQQRDELAAARQAWSEAGLSNYQFSLTHSCFCMPGDPAGSGSFVITVNDDAIAAAYTAGGERLSDAQAASLPTVEELFEIIDDEIGADEFAVEYDAGRGYPLSIEINPDSGLADNQISYRISELTDAPSEAALAELAAARAQWESAMIDDYRITLSIACFCGAPYNGELDVSVVDGVIVAASDKASGAPLSDDAIARLPTIAQLFDIIEAAYGTGADSIEVIYNTMVGIPEQPLPPSYGFPEYAHIDRIAGAADDEVTYRITDFAPASAAAL